MIFCIDQLCGLCYAAHRGVLSPYKTCVLQILITVTKKDLVSLGYAPSFASDIIRQAKKIMVEKGHDYYQSKKLDRVPTEAVETLLGITLSPSPAI